MDKLLKYKDSNYINDPDVFAANSREDIRAVFY
jgi:hypothetical protein